MPFIASAAACAVAVVVDVRSSQRQRADSSFTAYRHNHVTVLGAPTWPGPRQRILLPQPLESSDVETAEKRTDYSIRPI